MRVLLVGNGQHSNKRIIPSLIKINKVQEIDVVYNKVNHNKFNNELIRYLKSSEALGNNFYDLIIYATPPKVHLDNLKKYFEFSEHHLIEKPISSDIQTIFSKDFEKKYSSKYIFESLMYFHHPLVDIVKNILLNNDCKTIKASFKVPHGDKNHYRYKKSHGGGSILDQGIYPISLLSYLLKDLKVKEHEYKVDKSLNIDMSGFISFENKNFKSITAEWALGEEYSNVLEIETLKEKYLFPFIFSKNERTLYEYEVISKNHKKKISVGIHDQFKNMYEDILNKQYLKFKYSDYKELKKRYEIINNLISSNK